MMIAFGFLLALLVGYLVGHRRGFKVGICFLASKIEEVDTDKTLLHEFERKRAEFLKKSRE
jgi:hypothetical protein